MLVRNFRHSQWLSVGYKYMSVKLSKFCHQRRVPLHVHWLRACLFSCSCSEELCFQAINCGTLIGFKRYFVFD